MDVGGRTYLSFEVVVVVVVVLAIIDHSITVDTHTGMV